MRVIFLIAEVADVEPEKGVCLASDTAEARKSLLEEQQPARDDSTSFLCWKKGCNKVFKSSNAFRCTSMRSTIKGPQLPVSDRHVYKYRCNQCSLAFKTIEKLQLHSQYHVIRAATMCCLCQRSFRTLQALKKHLETSHLELSEADIQQLYGGLLMNGRPNDYGWSLTWRGPGISLDDEKRETKATLRKAKPNWQWLWILQEDSGSEPKRALPFRKGPNFTMEEVSRSVPPFQVYSLQRVHLPKKIFFLYTTTLCLTYTKSKGSTGIHHWSTRTYPAALIINPFKCKHLQCSIPAELYTGDSYALCSSSNQGQAAKLEAASGTSSAVSSSDPSGKHFQ